jgi:wyosine [tRNA(Phe)-imidazoG37] synthetase (radical SAM superfamily)
MSEHLKNVECLAGYEGNAFSHTENVGEEILNITLVHPMRQSAIEKFLSEAGESWAKVQKLIDQEKLLEVEY